MNENFTNSCLRIQGHPLQRVAIKLDAEKSSITLYLKCKIVLGTPILTGQKMEQFVLLYSRFFSILLSFKNSALCNGSPCM